MSRTNKTEIRIHAAIYEALNKKLHRMELGPKRWKARKALESKYKVSLLIEAHCISAWTKRTPVIKYFIRHTEANNVNIL